MARTKDNKRECAFMRLPTEIRLMIYRPLLISEYAMTEHDMNSKEYDYNRRFIQIGPDQTYNFHTAILSTNRKINGEAEDLCRRENNFVCLTSRRGISLEISGLQLVAKVPKAQGFWNACMTLTLDCPTAFDLRENSPWKQDKCEMVYAPEDGNPCNYIFCNSQLPEFCRILLENGVSVLRQMELFVEIDSTAQTGQATEIGSTPVSLSWVDELLNPLRQLHSFGVAHVQGPLSDRYKNELSASICKDCPTREAIIQFNMLSLDRADDQVSHRHFRKANLLYKAALSSIRSCKRLWWEVPTVIADGPFPGLTDFETISNLVVRLQARIASVYLQTGKLRMARIYTERALDPRRTYDNRHNKEKSISIAQWEDVVYAEVLHVAAKISYANHNIHEALYALDQAEECAPFDEEQKCRYEVWKSQSIRLNERRHQRFEQRTEAKEIQSRKEKEKIERQFMVSCHRKDRGDRLLQSGRSDLAALTYINALHRVSSLRQYWLEQVEVKTRRSSYSTSRNSLSFLVTSGPFKGLSAKYATKALEFKVQASIADAYSRSGRYIDVIHVAEAALDCARKCSYLSTCDCHHARNCAFGSEDRDWAEDQKFDYVKLYYHKALALEKIGDTSKAIKDMEKALKHDPESDMALAELSRLQRKLEEKVAHDSRIAEKLYIRRAQTQNKRELKSRELQQEKVRKLNILQDRLRKKQIRRREKA